MSIAMSSYYILFTSGGGFTAPRMSMSMGAIIGCSFIFILSFLKNKPTKNELLIYALISICFLYNTVTYMVLSYNHIKANKIYLEIGNTINYKVKQYEKETGDEVKYYFILTRTQDNVYPEGVLKVQSLTENPLTQYYCVNEFISVFAGKKVTSYMDSDLFQKNGIQAFSKDKIEKEYTTFEEEQIEINNGIIYILL